MTADRGPDLPGLRYVEHLGSGGFSEVYLYERDAPRIKVAVKLMKADVLDDSQRRQFVAEADVMAELAEHPYIVPVLGAGTAPDGRPYLVMRYFPPPDLGARAAREPLTVPEALRTAIQLASAVETAHRAGIIHRDIKPSNVLVSSYGVPALSDFGIAGRGDRDADENIGVSMPWSPPEVLTGVSNGTPASDVYSLAATIWNLLVGRSPFTIKGGDNGERALFSRIVHAKPPATGRADVPGSLDRLLQQAMAKDPAHRPQSAMELARHLQRVEQELRLARTEIVVLDAQVEAAPTSAAHSTAAAWTDEPATQLKPVTAVRAAQSPVPTAGTTRPAADPDPRTLHRPVRAEPATAGPAADPIAVRPRLILAAVVAGLLLAAIVAGGVLVSRGGEEDSPDALPDAPGPSAPTDVLPDDAILLAPEVVGRAAGAKAVFSWASQDAEDDYFVQVGDDDTWRPVAANRVTLSLPPRGELCIRVLVRRGTLASQGTGRGCVERALP